MGEFTREDKLTLPAAKKRGLRNKLTTDWRTKDWDTVAQMYECADKMADQLDDLRTRNKKLYKALKAVQKALDPSGIYALDDALSEERAHREREAGNE